MNLLFVVCVFLILAQFQFINEVDAKDHTYSVGSWFTSLERHFKAIKDAIHDQFLYVKNSAMDLLPHATVKKKTRLFPNDTNNESGQNLHDTNEHGTAKKKNRVKRHKKKPRKTKPQRSHPDEYTTEHTGKGKKFHKKPIKRKFVKTIVNNSASNESTRGRKPVDIIVHIKMNE